MSGGHGHGGSTFPPLEWLRWFIGLIFDLDKQVKYVGNWGVSRALYLSALFVGLLSILAHLIPNLPLFAFKWLFAVAPVWLPVALWMTCWYAWVWYIQALYLSGRHPVLLELKIPRDIMKSPRAMEIALMGFSTSSGETTFIHRAWKGQQRAFFSLEMASFGGEIHFYIWTWKYYRNVVESTIYAQYPEVELVEVEDYATRFQFDPDSHTCFCTDFRRETYLEGVDGRDIDAYPIKTYIDWELDKDPKEEHRIDPIAQIVEYLGSLKPTEQVWVQVVLRKAGNYDGVMFPKDMEHEWQHSVQEQVRRVRQIATLLPHENVQDLDHVDPEDAKPRFPHPTESQREQLQSMDRNFGKFAFEVGMRGIYITTGDLHGPTYGGLRYFWRPFASGNYRSQLKPKRWHNDFDYPWQDINGFRWNLFTRRFLDAYRRRSFFTSPWKTPTFVMTNEELATIWHPPSATVQTPGLERIPATKASAPSNLPR